MKEQPIAFIIISLLLQTVITSGTSAQHKIRAQVDVTEFEDNGQFITGIALSQKSLQGPRNELAHFEFDSTASVWVGELSITGDDPYYGIDLYVREDFDYYKVFVPAQASLLATGTESLFDISRPVRIRYSDKLGVVPGIGETRLNSFKPARQIDEPELIEFAARCEAAFRLGRADIQGAIKAYETLWNGSRESFMVAQAVANSYEFAGNRREAISFLERHQKRAEGTVWYQHRLAIARLHSDDDADRALEILATIPGNSDYTVLIEKRLQESRIFEARGETVRAISIIEDLRSWVVPDNAITPEFEPPILDQVDERTKMTVLRRLATLYAQSAKLPSAIEVRGQLEPLLKGSRREQNMLLRFNDMLSIGRSEEVLFELSEMELDSSRLAPQQQRLLIVKARALNDSRKRDEAKIILGVVASRGNAVESGRARSLLAKWDRRREQQP